MLKKISLLVLSSILTTLVPAQTPEAFRIFNSEGKTIAFSDMITDFSEKNVVLFGELHNNAISHWLELKITEALYATHAENLVLSAEMFESDNQLNIDEYLTGLVDENKFEADVRLWKNYKTDYKPLLNFAKDNNLRFVAANIPRRYASGVHKKGGLAYLETLSKEAKLFLPKLPIEYTGTDQKFYEELFSQAMGGHKSPQMQKMLPYIAQAQAAKDATMAYFIAKNLKNNKNSMVIHYNGALHSDNYAGIFLYLKKYAPKAQIGSITTVLQKNTETLDENNLKKADFIIVVPQDMTTTY